MSGVRTERTDSAGDSRERAAGRLPAGGPAAFGWGVAAVALATAVGIVLAALLSVLGLTSTPVGRLGAWLGGLGLLGGWQQQVSAVLTAGTGSAAAMPDVGWSTWAAGAPLLVTLSVMALVARAARRAVASTLIGVSWCSAGAGVAAALLVLVSAQSTETVTAAGSVVRREALTWLWTGGTRPGTVVGAVLLCGVTWWLATVASGWWRRGRPVLLWVFVVPGLLLTAMVGAGVAYLTSSPAVAVATVALYPLIGTWLLLAAGGVPVTIGVTRLTPEPYVLSSWDAGFDVALAALAAVVVLALLVGIVMRLRHTALDWASGLLVPILSVAFTAWAASTSVVPPDVLGGATAIAVEVGSAVLVTAGLSALTLTVALVARRDDAEQPVTRTD